MAGPFDILGNADEERLQALAEADQRKFAENFRAMQSRKAFQAAQQENRRLENTAALLGVETPEEPEQGFLGRTLDVLDTGGQMIRGVAAKYAGVPEFSDKDFLSAALHGDEKDLTVGDILRSKKVLQGQDWPTSILRGIAGFAGDVATDPLNYLSLGTFGIAKTGGLPLTTKAIKTATGETTTAASLFTNLTESIAESAIKSGKKLDSADIDRLAARPFRAIRSAMDEERKIKALGLEGTEVGQTALAAAKEKLVEQGLKPLNLATDFNARDLYEQPAIRFSPLLPGIGNKWLKIPPINGKAAQNIPGITPLTAEVFEKLNGQFYRTNLKIGQFLDRAVIRGKDGGRFARAASKAIDYERKLFGGLKSGLSRTSRIGHAMAGENIDELTAAKAAINDDVMLQADELARGVAPEDMATGVDIIEQGIRRHAGKDGKIARRPGAVKFEQEIFDREVDNAVIALNNREAGRGDRFRGFIDRVRSDFDNYAKIEIEEGILGSAVDGYSRRMINVKDGLNLDSEVGKFSNNLTKNTAGFDLARKYVTAAEAKIRGLDVNMNLLDSWMQRTVAHKHAIAEKRFLDRMVYEAAIPKDVYSKLHSLLASENEKDAFLAMDEFKRLGIKANPELAKRAFEGIAGLKKTTRGIILDPENYDYIKNIVQSGVVKPEEANAVLDATTKLKQVKSQIKTLRQAKSAVGLSDVTKAEIDKQLKKLIAEGKPLRAVADSIIDRPAIAAFEEARKMGLTFDDAEREAVLASYAKYEAAQNRTLGRMGESFYDRAGASELPPRFKDYLVKHVSRLEGTEAEGLRNFYEGVFPTSVAKAMNEMLDTRSTMMRLADWSKDDKLKEAMAGIANTSIGWTKVMKTLTTQIYPAYHAQNLSGSFFQAAHALPTLGSALNPVRLAQNYLIKKGKGTLVQEGTGRVFTGQMLDDLARRFHVKTVFGDSIDLINAQRDGINVVTAYKEGKKAKGVIGKAKSLSAAIENIGREHTFYELIRQGNSPEDAARIANQVLIDYSRNKTPFERNVLNHLFFFYTFPRQQTANTLHALFTKPGAITTQIHAVNGVRDLLANSEELSSIPDIDENMMSLRAKETFGRVIGKDAEGLPEILSDVGVPIKDLSRMMEVRFPKEMTVGSLLEAGGESVQRTMQLMASQTNPVLKMMAELGSGRNFFFDRPITDKTIRRMPDFEEAAARIVPYGYQRIPRGLGGVVNNVVWKWMDPVDNGDGTVTVDPVKYTIVTNLFPPIARAANTVKAMNKEGVPVSRKLVRALLPMKINSLNFETSGTYDRNRQLESFFEKRGLPTSKAQISFYKQNNTPQDTDEEIDDLLEE